MAALRLTLAISRPKLRGSLTTEDGGDLNAGRSAARAARRGVFLRAPFGLEGIAARRCQGRHALTPVPPLDLNQDYDYTELVTRERFRTGVTAWVLRYRDQPAVLMWGPCSEVMHRLTFPTAVQGPRSPAREQRADALAEFYVELLDLAHRLNPHHPVIYHDAEDLYLARFRPHLQQQTGPHPWFVHGTNVYNSPSSPTRRRSVRASGRIAQSS